MRKLICATKCSNNHMHPQIHNQDSLHFTITLVVLHGAISDSPDPLGASSNSPDAMVAGSGLPGRLPDPLVASLSRPTSWVQCPLRAGGIYTFPFPRQWLSAI